MDKQVRTLHRSGEDTSSEDLHLNAAVKVNVLDDNDIESIQSDFKMSDASHDTACKAQMDKLKTVLNVSDSVSSNTDSFSDDTVNKLDMRFGELDKIATNITQLYANFLSEGNCTSPTDEADEALLSPDKVSEDQNALNHCNSSSDDTVPVTETVLKSASMHTDETTLVNTGILRKTEDQTNESANLDEDVNEHFDAGAYVNDIVRNFNRDSDTLSAGSETLKSTLNSLSKAELYELAICHICHKQFKSKKNLRQHVYIHRTEKPFECTVCQKRFNFSVEVSRHMIKHTLDRPQSCPICERPFKCKKTMKQHIITHGTEKKYECFVCQKRFFFPNHLKNHISVHTGEAKHQCSICGKYYQRSGDLGRHLKTHSGERPYSCSVCQAAFIRSSDLTRHMLSHAGVKNYRCEICYKQYARSHSLKAHVLKKHSSVDPVKSSSS